MSQDRVQQRFVVLILVLGVKDVASLGLIWTLPGARGADPTAFGHVLVGDIPFFVLVGSFSLHGWVTFSVGKGPDGLEAVDLQAVGRGEGLGIPSPHLGCHSPGYLRVLGWQFPFGVSVLPEE